MSCFFEEFNFEFPKGIIEEVNVMTDTRNFEPFDLQTKGGKKIKPSEEHQK